MKHYGTKPFMTVDPGAVVGVALFRDLRLNDVATLRSKSRNKDYISGIHSIAKRLTQLIREWRPTTIYCEEPFVSTTGMARMSAAKGDIVKLTFFVGTLIHIGMIEKVPVRLVSVRDWKGQLPKARTQQLVEQQCRRYRRERDVYSTNWNSHIVDAVGIGMYLLGRL